MIRIIIIYCPKNVKHLSTPRHCPEGHFRQAVFLNPPTNTDTAFKINGYEELTFILQLNHPL